MTPLLIATHKGHHKVVKTLLAHAEQQGITSVVLQQYNQKGTTALLAAAISNHLEIINTLLKYAKQAQLVKDI